MPPAVDVWSLNHWTAREVPVSSSGIMLPGNVSLERKVGFSGLPRVQLSPKSSILGS